jgi:Holliday junction resolvase-like predicted endonuclease
MIPLDENEVIDRVCTFLEDRGYEVVQRLSTNQRGIDIIAEDGELRICVEAKGSTSSKARSKNFGKPYASADVQINVAEAFYTAACRAHDEVDYEQVSAVAFEETELYSRYFEPLAPACDALGIGVFWVGEAGARYVGPASVPGLSEGLRDGADR